MTPLEMNKKIAEALGVEFKNESLLLATYEAFIEEFCK